MMERAFSCTRGTLTIRGTEYRNESAPGRKKGCPAAVLSHGFGGNQTDLVFYAKLLADMGYAAYCFDFCGGCVVGKSDGDSLDMTIDTEVADLKAVVDYVKGLPYTDEERIVLIGASQGGYVSGIAAADMGDEIERLILFYPALCIPDDARRGALGGADYSVEDVPDAIDTFGVRISKKYHDAVVDKDAVAQISGYKGPVLLIHGSDDTLVNNRYAKQAADAYENCQLQILEGAGHGFSQQQKEEVAVSVREFLNGRRQILCIRVRITDLKKEEKEEETVQYVYFDGDCATGYFVGSILPGAVDEQHYGKDGGCSLCATYDLEGRDGDGNACRIHIVNRNAGSGFKPKISTDSPKLSFLNESDLAAALEIHEGGLTVRIFA